MLQTERNVHDVERAFSIVLGAGLLGVAARRFSLGRAPVALAAGALLHRGLTGHCSGYSLLGVNTAASGHRALPSHRGARPRVSEAATFDVRRSLTIGKPAAELYRLWLSPDTFTRVMEPLAKATAAEDGAMRWQLTAPVVHHTFEWTTRVVEEREPELVRWDSGPEGNVRMRGALELRPAERDWGTAVTLSLQIDPPGGALGRALLELLGAAPRLALEKVLRRFKALAETGEIPTLHHNPAARNDGRDA